MQLEAFIAQYPPADDKEIEHYDSATNTVAKNNQWAQDNQADLERWLQGHTDGEIVKMSRTGSNHGLREKLNRMHDVKRRGSLSPWYNQFSHLI